MNIYQTKDTGTENGVVLTRGEWVGEVERAVGEGSSSMVINRN